MKPKPNFNKQLKAFTLIELFFVLFVVFILAAMILPAISRPHSRAPSIACVNQLKHISYAFRIFAYENQDRFPMSVPEEDGGSLEYKDDPLATYRHFQVMSNELSVPKVLICPSDENRMEAKNFTGSFEPDPDKRPATGPQVGNQVISYFVGVDASEEYPQMILAGDRNLMMEGKDLSKGQSLMVILTPEVAREDKKPKQLLQYSQSIHKHRGNVALADGSVQQFTSEALRAHILRSDRADDEPMERLAVPGNR